MTSAAGAATAAAVIIHHHHRITIIITITITITIISSYYHEYAEDTQQAEPVVKVADAVKRGKVQAPFLSKFSDFCKEKERHGPFSVGKARGAADLATVEGKLSSAGQKHFYLETQTTYAYPDGMGGLVVNSSCQTLDWAQTMLCKVFHLPKSKVTVQNQRIGGAYGGKAMLFAPVCAATAVAAMRTKRPVMVQLDRTPDFRSLGARAPFEASWNCSALDPERSGALGYDVSSGKISSLKQDILQNVGFDMLGFSQASSVNCYDIPHAQLHCKGWSKQKSLVLSTTCDRHGLLFFMVSIAV
ncbi:AAO4 [Symbiodinium sp. KB8]|nr:AAO4 [Symbiodinium sp. KB8]